MKKKKKDKKGNENGTMTIPFSDKRTVQSTSTQSVRYLSLQFRVQTLANFAIIVIDENLSAWLSVFQIVNSFLGGNFNLLKCN